MRFGEHNALFFQAQLDDVLLAATSAAFAQAGMASKTNVEQMAVVNGIMKMRHEAVCRITSVSRMSFVGLCRETTATLDSDAYSLRRETIRDILVRPSGRCCFRGYVPKSLFITQRIGGCRRQAKSLGRRLTFMPSP
jgi:hypothetical protein